VSRPQGEQPLHTAAPGDRLPGTGPAAVRVTDVLGAGVLAGFSGRGGGVSAPPYAALNLGLRIGDDQAAVLANRAALAASCGLQADELAWMRQVHGNDVGYVGAGSTGPAEPVDAIFTDVPGRALCVLVADCVPVLIADPVARIAGAAHAGRQGLVAGVVQALIEAMTGAGAQPDRMRAITGPAICGGCYEVPGELQASVAAAVPQARCATSWGTAGLDISAGVHEQLRQAGVGWSAADGRCTRESADLFSYRRDGLTGRLAGLVWLAP
jgi:YfiH family protein